MLPKLFAGTPPALPQRSGLCCLQNLPCLSSCLHFFRMHQSACSPSLPVYSGTSFRIANTGNCFPEYFRQSVLSVPTFSGTSSTKFFRISHRKPYQLCKKAACLLQAAFRGNFPTVRVQHRFLFLYCI